VNVRRVVAVASPIAFLVLARRARLGKVSAGEEQVFRFINRHRPELHHPA
jgi:hypothetical protein